MSEIHVPDLFILTGDGKLTVCGSSFNSSCKDFNFKTDPPSLANSELSLDGNRSSPGILLDLYNITWLGGKIGGSHVSTIATSFFSNPSDKDVRNVVDLQPVTQRFYKIIIYIFSFIITQNHTCPSTDQANVESFEL
jgi:hypothetical protein